MIDALLLRNNEKTTAFGAENDRWTSVLTPVSVNPRVREFEECFVRGAVATGTFASGTPGAGLELEMRGERRDVRKKPRNACRNARRPNAVISASGVNRGIRLDSTKNGERP